MAFGNMAMTLSPEELEDLTQRVRDLQTDKPHGCPRRTFTFRILQNASFVFSLAEIRELCELLETGLYLLAASNGIDRLLG